MRNIKLILSCVIVGVIVALIYYGFETGVAHSIDFVWNTLLQSEAHRWIVIPITLFGALIFFAAQHYLDPKSEQHETKGLGGNITKPTFKKLFLVLFIGYFSLLAGASLGPEAILVPACMTAGGLLGLKLLKQDSAVKILSAAALIALMASFFHSFWVGLLSILLVKKEANVKITAPLVAIAVAASASAAYTLSFIAPKESYFKLPKMTWEIALIDIIACAVLLFVGFLATFGLKYSHNFILKLRKKAKLKTWWQQALLASLGLSAIYLVGGPLVQFTGNNSVLPMLHQASALGILGLGGVVLMKILAIGWSKAMGYRGGLIFPMAFVAAALTALVQFLFHDLSFGIGFVAIMVGIFIAESKAKILL